MLWLGRVGVISLPVEIDTSNADQVRDDLLSVLGHGPSALIVDLGGTTFCDSAGVNALVRAHRRAVASHVAMRLAASAPAVARVLAITGVDRLINVYPSVAEALPGPDHHADGVIPHRRHASTDADPDDCAAQPG